MVDNSIKQKEIIVDLINKTVIAQGEIQRAVIWLSRLHADLQKLMKELMADGAKITEKKDK